MSRDVLDRLAARLREEGGLIAGALLDAPRGEAMHGPRAAVGPRGAGREEELELVVEAVREGYLLHYGSSRLMDTSDADLALLAGDRLYALGLQLLADAGDLASVAELSDVITLSAAAHAREEPTLADAVWAAGADAVGSGPLSGHADAKAAARRGDRDAEAALRAVARQLSGDMAP